MSHPDAASAYEDVKPEAGLAPLLANVHTALS
jgi:hypothetical protein